MEIKITCSECNGVLGIYRTMVTGNGDLIIDVEPCDTCMEREFDKGKEEGIDECIHSNEE